MNCPECNSENLVKRGLRGGHQRYACRDCGRHFTEGVKLKPRMPKTPLEGETCPYCGSTVIKRDGKLERGGQRFKCVTKTIPKRKKCKEAKWLSEEALQIAEKRREAKGKGEKERQLQRQKNQSSHL